MSLRFELQKPEFFLCVTQLRSNSCSLARDPVVATCLSFFDAIEGAGEAGAAANA